jgi:hypothetical protein
MNLRRLGGNLPMNRKNYRRSKIGLLASVLFVLLTLAPLSRLEASTAMCSFNAPNFYSNGYYLPQTIGDIFTPTTNITVTSLGAFDYQDNGLGEAHEVSIFDKSGALLASTYVPAGTAGPLEDHFRYASIAPLELTAGQTYTLAELFLTSVDVVGYTNPGKLSPAAAISLPGFSARYALWIDEMGFPTQTVLASAAFYIGPNFQYTITDSPSIGAQTPSAAPLPPSLLLLGSGLVGLGLLGRRRKKS